MSEATKELKLYPSWKQALHDLEVAGIEPGQTIEKEWLENAFGIEQALTIADAEKNRALFRSSIWELRGRLLTKHRLMLRSVGGVGYQVIESEKQTEVALRDRGAEVARALERMHDEVTFVRVELLSDAQRKANADAVAKVGALIGMTRKQLGFESGTA